MASSKRATVLPPTNPRYFFKAMIPKNLEAKKVRIPDTFARRHGKNLSVAAKLKLRDGRTWHIGLTRDGRKIWLQHGWDEFINYYSISSGYFVVFKYVKNSKFHVVILDDSSCEMEYPAFQNSSSVPSNIASPITIDSSSEEEEKREGGEEEEEVIEVHGASSSVTALDIDRALTAARAFNSANPYCLIMLRASYVGRKTCVMYFPVKFSKQHLTGVSGFIQLQNFDGRQWSVKCTNKNGNARLTEGWCKFAKENNLLEGDVCIFELIPTKDTVVKVTVFPVRRTDFANTQSSNSTARGSKVENNVLSSQNQMQSDDSRAKRQKIDESGDVNGKRKAECSTNGIGDLQSSENIDLINALQSKGITVGTRFQKISEEERERVSGAARHFKSKHPAFMLILKPFHVENNLMYIPADFGWRHFEGNEVIKLRDPSGNEYMVHVVSHHGMCVKRMTSCFKENNVRIDDILICELIEGEERALKVSIFHASDL